MFLLIRVIIMRFAKTVVEVINAEPHEWVPNTGECKYCKVVCDHQLKNSDGKCIVCGYHRDSTSGMFENFPK